MTNEIISSLIDFAEKSFNLRSKNMSLKEKSNRVSFGAKNLFYLAPIWQLATDWLKKKTSFIAFKPNV